MNKKRFTLLFVVLFTIACIVSCEKTDLTEVYNRFDRLESQNAVLPKLTPIQFLAHDNVENLIVDVDGEIVGDSIVEC